MIASLCYRRRRAVERYLGTTWKKILMRGEEGALFYRLKIKIFFGFRYEVTKFSNFRGKYEI